MKELIEKIGYEYQSWFLDEGEYQPTKEQVEEKVKQLIHQEQSAQEKKLKQNIGLLRQWLNERTSKELITNKDIEEFLIH